MELIPTTRGSHVMAYFLISFHLALLKKKKKKVFIVSHQVNLRNKLVQARIIVHYFRHHEHL